MHFPIESVRNEAITTKAQEMNNWTKVSGILWYQATTVSYVESGQPQVFPVGSSSPDRPTESRPSSHLFFWNLQQEVRLSRDFVVHPIRWGRCLLAAADPHAHAWLTLQSHRGLAPNTLDAYSRALVRYFRFLAQLHLSCVSVTHAEVGLYLASLQADGTSLSNACNLTSGDDKRHRVCNLIYAW
jgi:hypothetical protein